MFKFFLSNLFVFFCVSCFSQEIPTEISPNKLEMADIIDLLQPGVVGDTSNRWQFIPYDDAVSATCKIQSKRGFNSGFGTGVIIKKFLDQKHPKNNKFVRVYILTVSHVVDEMDCIDVFYSDGNGYTGCKLLKKLDEFDIAIIEACALSTIVVTPLAETDSVEGDPVKVCGFGYTEGDHAKHPRYFSSSIYRRCRENKFLFLNTDVLPGDSGSPIFNAKNEVIGVVSGGGYWFFETEPFSNSMGNNRYTWPTRAPSTVPIRKLLLDTIAAETATGLPVPITR